MRTFSALAMWLAWTLTACTASLQQTETSLSVRVTDDSLLPLFGVEISMDGTPIAATDEAGQAAVVVQARSRGRVRIQARCPQGYREAPARSVSLSRKASSALSLHLTCRPELRKLAVVVRAPGAEGLTLRADGAPVAEVQADATAHFILQRAPGSTLRLSLDTSQAPALLPQFPVREIHVSDQDEIVVFDQVLIAKASKSKRHHLVARAPRHVPYAIGR